MAAHMRPMVAHAINQPINIEVGIRPIEVEIRPPAKQALREDLIMTKAKLLHGQAQQYELQQLEHPEKTPITVVPEPHLTLEAQLKTAHIHADLAPHGRHDLPRGCSHHLVHLTSKWRVLKNLLHVIDTDYQTEGLLSYYIPHHDKAALGENHPDVKSTKGHDPSECFTWQHMHSGGVCSPSASCSQQSTGTHTHTHTHTTETHTHKLTYGSHCTPQHNTPHCQINLWEQLLHTAPQHTTLSN